MPQVQVGKSGGAPRLWCKLNPRALLSKISRGSLHPDFIPFLLMSALRVAVCKKSREVILDTAERQRDDTYPPCRSVLMESGERGASQGLRALGRKQGHHGRLKTKQHKTETLCYLLQKSNPQNPPVIHHLLNIWSNIFFCPLLSQREQTIETFLIPLR